METDVLKVLQENPALFQIAGARRKLLWFAQYVKPTYVTTQFHATYARILDYFAQGKIKNLIIQCQPQLGKALEIFTPVFTNKGWKRHFQLEIGDYVMDAEGNMRRVTNITKPYKCECRAIYFQGTTHSITAALPHEWLIIGRGIVETSDLRVGDTIFRNDRNWEISKIGDVEVKDVNCIEVEGGIYCAGYARIPTHNSELSSRMLPAFMLGLNPDLKMVIASYAATIAKDFNRDVQRIIDSEEYHSVFPDTCLNNSNVVSLSEGYLRNSDVFEVVNHNGSLRVVGRGGSLTSKTADVMIFDDLYKDASEANSPIVRESAWDWYTKVARTRLHNNSQQLIVFTRWHSEDIIGKIIDSEPVVFAKEWKDFENVGDSWVLVNFEAIKTSPPSEIDPRQEGEVLWPERHSKDRMLAQKELDPVGFECLYQGNPDNAESRLYMPFKTWTTREEYGRLVRRGCCIDVADEGTDNFCAITYDIVISEQKIFNEQKRRFEPLLFALVTDIDFTDANTDVTLHTTSRMINTQGSQKVWVESNNGGAQYEKNLKRMVRAITVPYHESTNKESRIITNAPFVNSQIIMPFGWETKYPKFYEHITMFLHQFSANAHDDGPDCLTSLYIKELADGNIMGYSNGRRGVRY